MFTGEFTPGIGHAGQMTAHSPSLVPAAPDGE